MMRGGGKARSAGFVWSALFALLILSPSPAAAAISLVQDVFVQSPAGTDETTKTATFSANVTAGNALIATISSTGGSVTVTGGGVTWTQAVTAQVSGAQRIWIFYGTNSSGGTNTVTVEGTAGRWTLEVGEWSGLDNSATLDGTATSTGNFAIPSTGNVATTSPGDLLIAFHSDLGAVSAAPSADRAFLVLEGGVQSTSYEDVYTNQTHNPSYRVVPSTGTYSNQWTTTASTAYATAIAAFKADASETSYQGSGAVSTVTSANPACALPAPTGGIKANDIGLWHTHSKDNNTHTYPSGSGWTQVTQVNQTASLTHSWAWKRFAGGETGNQTVTVAGTNLKQCRIVLIRGVRTSGDPHEVAAAAQGSTKINDPAAVSINNVGALLVALIAVGDQGTSHWGSWSNTVGLSFNGSFDTLDSTTATGSNGNLALAYGRATSTGPFPTSVDFGSKGWGSSEAWITFTVALVPGCPVVSDTSYVVASARNGQATVYWSSANPVVILRKATTAFTDSEEPTNTQSYSAGATIGGATVIYDGTTATTGITCTATSCTDTTVTNGTTYHYMVFAKNAAACYSSGTAIATKPAAAAPEWSYGTTAASMAPVSLDPWSDRVVAGSNDDKVHGKSAADGTMAFAPFIAGGPIQARPATVPAEYRTPATAVNIAYVTSQDGYLYAMNTGTGAEVWKACLNPQTTCDPLGSMLQGGAAVWLQALAPLTFTGSVTSDVVFVGTRNTGTGSDSNNKVYAVNGDTGAIVWTFAPGTMDIISSTPYVDHGRGTVWVTTRSKSGTQNSLWKLDAATGALAFGTNVWSFGDIDSSPVASADGTLLYVGTNAGELTAVRIVARDSQLAGTVVTHTPAGGAGAVRGTPWWLSFDSVGVATPDTIVFVRNLTIHSVNFTGTAFSSNWTQTVAWTPSTPVDDEGNAPTGNLYFGGSDGKVHRLRVSDGVDLAQVPATAISGTFGEPTINWDRGVIHVGGSDGQIYTFTVGF